MVEVTIGVPVFNGAQFLDNSLACLARQTFRDFKVLIFDNASTDGTEQIARGWAGRDSRFEYHRHSENVGALKNFTATLLAASSPWFLWRADDDLSDDHYVETLYRLATAQPGCKLAVGRIISTDSEGRPLRFTDPPDILDPASVRGRLQTLFSYHASWFYGLWDRAALVETYLPICERFPFAYAADHLALYGPIIDGKIRTTNKTEFVQRARPTSGPTRMRFAKMVEARIAFHRDLRRQRAGRRMPFGFRTALVALEPFYLERTVPTLAKTARTGLRELFGLTGQKVAGRHFERDR